ncbi:helix-turn-helix transcriptional regulator [Kangiella sediminilitoris]|uniref:Phage transcriptional regulator n=1 Tax=Kangiella sediminilitoris TaxID=1144748 RepID=A0A1B3B8Z7_9GAMM|nr:AlpA family transcriptional regulator [Kangiella sediminilitoris]AOE49263.1 Phage transcriptional regulator [Kangiella sediminilitoris]
MNTVNSKSKDPISRQELARQPHRVLRLKDVMAKLGVSRSTVYKLVADNKLPKPISLGARSIGWIEKSIDSWLEKQEEKANQRG